MSEADDEARVIAGLIPKSAQRAILKLSHEWTEEGARGPKRADAYSLWWGKASRFKLVDHPQVFAVSSAGIASYKYRLTPLGLRVRRILETHEATPSR